MKTRGEQHERAGGRLVLVVVLVLTLLAAGGYAAAYYVAGDKLARDASIGGVDVGGLTRAEAEDALRDGLAEAVTRPIKVVVEGRSAEVDPAEVGLEVDYVGSVATAAREQSWNPGDLWDYFAGSNDTEPIVEVDDSAITAAIADLESGLGTAPIDGAVAFDAGRVVVTRPVPGRGLEPDSTRAALVASYLTGQRVELEITRLTPDIDDGDVDEAVDTFAEPAMSAPIVLRIGSAGIRLSPSEYAAALSLEARDGALVPTVDSDVLASLVEKATLGNGRPVDASIELVDGTPTVVEAEPGVTFEADGVAAAFLEAVAKPEGERTAKVKGTVTQPAFTTKEARALGVRRKVSEFTTYFPYAEYRNTNIGRAAEIVDGTLLKPGDVFSLNDIVGERTVENGFTVGTIISDGIFVQDLGGGVSQMATTTFNAMFYAGLEDIEHKPHSVYIDRYPVGREATVAFGLVDLRFRNDTDYGVLVNAELTRATPSSQGVLTVRMFSTKVWDISEVTSDRYAYVAPGTRTLDTKGCAPNTGYSGFQVDVTRIFKRPGGDEVAKREKFHTDYNASDTVICRPPGSLP